MKYRWINKNVNFEILAEKVEVFFKEKGLRTRLDKRSPREHFVYIVFPYKKKRKIVTAKIYGKSNDFSVEFPAEYHFFSTFGPLMLMFGGGFLVRSELEEKEVLGNLENEFWIYMEKVVQKIKRL